MMFETIPAPAKGEKLRASWGASVANRLNELTAAAPAGMLTRAGMGGVGFQPLPRNLRNSRAGQLPWKGVGGSDSGAAAFYIYIPGGSLIVDGEIFDASSIEGISSAFGMADWYTYDSASDISDPATLSLYLYKEGDDGEGEDPESILAVIAVGSESITGEIVIQVPLFVAATETVAQNSVGMVTAQFAAGPIIWCSGAGGSSATVPRPFDIEKTVVPVEDGEEGETEEVSVIARPVFHFGDSMVTVTEVCDIPSTGTLWLVGTRQDPIIGGRDGDTWTWAVQTSSGTETNYSQRINIKLYDLEDGEITCDYRSTFLDVAMPDETSEQFVGSQTMRRTSNGGITLSAQQSGAVYMEIDNGTGGNKVRIDASDLDGRDAGLKTLTVNTVDSNGDTQTETFKVLADDDITINVGATLPDIDVITGIDFSLDNGYLVATVKKTNLVTGEEDEGTDVQVAQVIAHTTQN